MKEVTSDRKKVISQIITSDHVIRELGYNCGPGGLLLANGGTKPRLLSHGLLFVSV